MRENSSWSKAPNSDGQRCLGQCRAKSKIKILFQLCQMARRVRPPQDQLQRQIGRWTNSKLDLPKTQSYGRIMEDNYETQAKQKQIKMQFCLSQL